MKIIRAYIRKIILKMTLLVLLALLGLEVFMIFARQLNDLNYSYTVFQAFRYALFNLPTELYQLFPMAGLLGVLLGLSVLGNQSELIVLRAAGVSIGQITSAVLRGMLVMILVVSVIGETLAPIAKHWVNQQKMIALSRGQALNTIRGIWMRDGQDFIHIQAVESGELLEGISRYRFDKLHRLVEASYAKRAFYEEGHWLMQEIQQTMLSENKTTSQFLSQAIWPLLLNPSILKMTAVEPDEMSLPQLYQSNRYREKNGLSTGTYSLSFWKRLWQPVATIVMMLLAIPFIFGPLRTATLGKRLLVGVGVGFSFYILNEFFGSMGTVLQFPPFLAAILPTLLFSVFGFVLIQKWK